MLYRKSPPPANPTIEDLQRWAEAELSALEQVIAALRAEVDQLKET